MLRIAVITSIALVIGIGCASKRPSTPAVVEGGPSVQASDKAMKRLEAGLRPKWMDTPPSDPDFFYGVGAASATGDPVEDRQKADYAARIEIASQLKIKISSIVLSIMQYRQQQIGKKSREQWSEEYSERMSAVVDTTALEGSKVLARWHDPDIDLYYSLVSMSKSEFRAMIKKQIEDAQNLAMDQYHHASEALRANNITAALKGYANGLRELKVIQDIPFEVDLNGDGTKEYFRPEVTRKIETIISELHILAINANQKGNVGKPLAKPLIAKVVYRRSPVKDMPFVFTFIRGQGQLDENVQTNSYGKASSKIYKLESAGTNVVEARADLTKIVDPQIIKELKGVEPPKERFTFSAEAVKVVLRISEQNLGNPVLDSFVEAAIVTQLTQAGFAVISPQKTRGQFSLNSVEEAMGGNYRGVQKVGKRLRADVVIVGRASATFSSRVLGTAKCCYARATVRAVDVNSGKVLAAADLSQVKGFANTAQKAGEKALRKVSEKISAQIVEQLKDSL